MSVAHKFSASEFERIGRFDVMMTHNIEAVQTLWRQFQLTAWHTPFQDYDWVQAWFKTVPSTRQAQPVIILGYDHGKLVFILPLMRERAHGVWRLTWLAAEVNDLNAPLISLDILEKLDAGTVENIWRFATSGRSSIDSVHLLNQPSTLGDARNPFLTAKSLLRSNNSYDLELQRDWTQLYARLRSSKSRRRIRQKENRLRSLGRLRFMCLREPGDQARAIDRILLWKSSQLESRGDRNPFATLAKDPFANPALKQSILNCSQQGSARKLLRVYGLFLDDRMLAGMIAFTSKGRFSILTTSFDPDQHVNCSPGLILLVKTIELAARAGQETYDFLVGEESYKRQWCRNEVNIYCGFSGLTTAGRLSAFASFQKYKLKKNLKSSPRAMKMLRRANLHRVKMMSLLDRRRGPRPV